VLLEEIGPSEREAPQLCRFLAVDHIPRTIAKFSGALARVPLNRIAEIRSGAVANFSCAGSSLV
jgi:hypothetical protein